MILIRTWHDSWHRDQEVLLFITLGWMRLCDTDQSGCSWDGGGFSAFSSSCLLLCLVRFASLLLIVFWRVLCPWKSTVCHPVHASRCSIALFGFCFLCVWNSRDAWVQLFSVFYRLSTVHSFSQVSMWVSQVIFKKYWQGEEFILGKVCSHKQSGSHLCFSPDFYSFCLRKKQRHIKRSTWETILRPYFIF